MTETYVTCNLCGSEESRSILKPYGRTYVACLRCGLVFRTPMPVEEEVQGFYSEALSSAIEVERRRTRLYRDFLQKSERSKPEHGRLLDIGCGYGEFMRSAAEYGWEAHGVELSREACKYMKERYGLRRNYRISRLIEKLVDTDVARRISVFHLYCFTRASLRRISETSGFGRIRILNGRPSRGDPYRAFSPGLEKMVGLGKSLIHLLTQLMFYTTGGAKVMGSSLEAYAIPESLRLRSDSPRGFHNQPPPRSSSKVRVLHLITRLDRGGSAENTVLTVSGLDKDRFETILATGKTTRLTPRASQLGLEKGRDWIGIPQLVRDIHPLKDVQAFIRLLSIIHKGRFDIVHTHSSKAGILGRLAAHIAGVPIIVHTPHGHVFYGYYGPAITRLFLVLEKIWARFTDRIITLTENGRREHVAFGVAGPDKFVAIPSGVELEPFLSVRIDVRKVKKTLGIDLRERVVGSIGRLVPVKGYRYLIQASKWVLRKRPDVTFLLVGDGPLRDELMRLAQRLDVADKFVFAGHREDEPELIAAMDLFVLPSLNEGMGRVLVEAMAEGKPVVATEVGGVADVVVDRQTGLLVPPKDPEAMAEAILKLLQDEKLARRMGVEGRKRVYPRYSAKVMVEKIGRLYMELLMGKERGTVADLSESGGFS